MLKTNRFDTYEIATEALDKVVWQSLGEIQLSSIIKDWLELFGKNTRKSYASAVAILSGCGLLEDSMCLQAFSLVNHEAVIDRIKKLPMSENSRQARAAMYISFTRYLSRRFPSVFRKAIASREGADKTFYKVHDKVTTHAMTQAEWILFFNELEAINPRDALLGKITLQGGKRIGEVLSLFVGDISFGTRQIIFEQSKTRGMIQKTIITYPQTIMDRLKDYVGDRKGLVFVTSNGRGIALNQLARTFATAGKRAGIAFKVTPHVLRASAVTYLKGQRFSDSDIMKITGHSSAEMVHAYDKAELADNPSRLVTLIC